MTEASDLERYKPTDRKRMPPKGARLAGSLDINVLIGFVFGVAFLITMLVLAIGFPNPTTFQIQVFMTVLSLSAAGVGAILPGRIEFRHKNLLRATGAAAFFAVVWFTKPVIESQVVRLERPQQTANAAINTFFSHLDSGEAIASYQDLDQIPRDHISAQVWQQLYDANLKGLGKRTRRKLMGVNAFESPPGYPVGLYEQYNYLTKYANVPGCRQESLSVRATQDKQWRVFSYVISPTTIDCGPTFNSD